MNSNMGNLDRIVRLVAGCILIDVALYWTNVPNTPSVGLA